MVYNFFKNEYDEAELKSGAKGAQSFLAQAAEWEKQNEYERAVNCYMKVDTNSTNNNQLIAQSLYKVNFIKNYNIESFKKYCLRIKAVTEINLNFENRKGPLENWKAKSDLGN